MPELAGVVRLLKKEQDRLARDFTALMLCSQRSVRPGLWDRWREPNSQWIKSCSILTTTPNAVTGAVHDRMPVILRKDGLRPVA